MRRTIPLLTAILALQVGLAALLAVRKDPLASTTPQTPLIESSIQSVDHLLIESHTSADAASSPTGATASTGTTGSTGSTGSSTSAAPTRVELVKQNGEWILPDYFNAPADKFKLNDVLDELSDLKRGLPIATTSSALERFKLMDDDFDRRLTLSEGSRVLSTVYFGSSAGVRKTDARTARDHAVYNVDLATYELPTQPTDWFDAAMLESDAGTVSQLDVTASGQPTVELQRQKQSAASAAQTGSTVPTAPTAQANPAGAAATATPTTATGTAAGTATAAAWVDPALPAGHQVDGTHVDTLTREIADMRVDAILGLSAQPQWQQDHPLLTLVIHNDKHPAQVDTWTLSAPLPAAGTASTKASAASGASAAPPARSASRRAADSAASGAAAAAAHPAANTPEYYVLKDSAQPWYFKVSAATGKQLLDDSASTALLPALQSAGKESAHEKPGAHGGARAHRRRQSPAST